MDPSGHKSRAPIRDSRKSVAAQRRYMYLSALAPFIMTIIDISPAQRKILPAMLGHPGNHNMHHTCRGIYERTSHRAGYTDTTWYSMYVLVVRPAGGFRRHLRDRCGEPTGQCLQLDTKGLSRDVMVWEIEQLKEDQVS